MSKHGVCKKDYAWNPIRWTCEYDKHFEIDECLKTCFCLKGIVVELVITPDEHVNTPETVEILMIKEYDIKYIFCTLFISNLIVVKNHNYFLLLHMLTMNLLKNDDLSENNGWLWNIKNSSHRI